LLVFFGADDQENSRAPPLFNYMPGNRREEDSGRLILQMVLSAILKNETKPARRRNTPVDQSLSASALALPRRNMLRVIWSSCGARRQLDAPQRVVAVGGSAGTWSVKCAVKFSHLLRL
jgi:hypothetical protein